MVTAALRSLARLWPRPVETSAELERAVAFLGWPVGAETVVRAGYGAALVTAAVLVPATVAVVPGPFVPVALAVVAALALGAAHGIHRAPVGLAAARRTRALGAAPGLVGRAVLRMHVAPSAEAAAAFAARTGDGPLADSLAAHVRRARGAPGAGLEPFAEEWAAWFPALRRAASLLDAAADAPAGERARTLDRALEAVLSGTSEAAASFGSAVRGPATAIYAFGVLLPLSLVAVLPAAGAAGISLALPVLVVVYDVLLPVAVAGAGAWLLVRRPVAFPPPRVPRDHPDVPDRPWRVVGAGLVAAVVGGGAAALALPLWTAPIAGVGGGVGATLVARYRPVQSVRERVLAVEDGLPDALYLVGRRVTEGAAVESAVARAAGEVPGETGRVLCTAARRQRLLRVGVREAFLGDRGALADVPSPRARSTVALLALAAAEGRPAGRAVTAMADHLEDLAGVERRARRQLSTVTSTLSSTAGAFGPMVAGATVGLSEGIRAAGPDAGLGGGAAVPGTPALGLAVGFYVLVLAVLLSALAAGLERGVDGALVGYRAGVTLLSATAVYLVAFAATGLLV